MGLKKGDIIGLSLPDWPEYSIMYYACAKLGMATTPISPRYREKEFALMLGHSGAKGVIIPDIWGGFDYLKGIMNHPDFEKYDVSSVGGAWSGGAAAPVEVATKITRVFGCAFMSGYGTTECGGNHFTYRNDPIKLACSTVGPPLDTMEVRITDTENQTVSMGVAGEVCARGAMVMKGYYKNSDATDAAFDKEGWFHSGDLGVIDEKGYLQIVGRIKNMILRGGENIYASEIEEFLYTHPDVGEAHVVGYPDEYLGERTCAFIVPKTEGKVFTRDDIVDLFGTKIAKHKIPDRVETITELPLTPSGKVKKFVLRDIAKDLIKK